MPSSPSQVRGRDPNLPLAQLKQFRAHVYFPPEQIYISQADGIFCGVRVSATGQLINRADRKPNRTLTDEEWRQRMELLQRVAEELGRFAFVGGPPSLQAKFTGDLGQMEQARIDVTLSGERIQARGYEVKALTAAATWADQKLEPRQLDWTDNGGLFSGRASWNALTKDGDFQARSSVDAKQLLEALGFGKYAPEVNLHVAAGDRAFRLLQFLPDHSALERNRSPVQVENFAFKNIPLLQLSGSFSWDGQRTMWRDVRLRHASGDLLVDYLDAPGDFRLNLESSINPGVLRPWLDGGLREFLGEWEWPRPPILRLKIHGSSTDPATWIGEGDVAQQRARFRGVWMDSAEAEIHFANGAITFDDLRVTRDGGVGTGSFTYDPVHHEVRIANLRTTLRPTDAIYWIEPKLFKVVAPYKFRSPPSLVANGIVQYHGGKDTHLEIAVENPSGMEYVFLGKTLPSSGCKGSCLSPTIGCSCCPWKGVCLVARSRAQRTFH